jgi:CRISPR system Cascade subunit CasA
MGWRWLDMVNEYNLLDEPWIEVTMADGSMEKMGIIDVFKNAHNIRCISGDSSSQDVAIMRILLAVLYAVYAGDDDYYDMGDGDVVKLWKSLYDRGFFDSSEISQYLERYRERFFLFGDCPFYQAPITVGTEYSLMKLIGNVSESENKPRLFKSVSSRLLQGISFAEAARWLVYVNAFDDTSAKPKAKGTPSPGAGWLGKIGIVFAQGDTLFETLMLNFVLLNNGGEPFDIDERPVWERELCYDERIEVPKPRNPMRLFTIQSRRILLTRSENQVIGYILLGGDVFEKNDVVAETMTMWRCDDKTG